MKKLYLIVMLIAFGAVAVLAQDGPIKPLGENDTYVGEAYPNPFNEQIMIAVDTKTDNLVHVEMFDIIGNKVDEKIYTVNRGTTTLNFNPETEKGINKGAYLLRISVGNKVYTQRLLKR
jgi:hypothetical protein